MEPALPPPATGRVCRVCARATAQYTCPSCNVPYCTAACYRSHNEACTEKFYAAHVMGELQVEGVSVQTKRGMLAALRAAAEGRASPPSALTTLTGGGGSDDDPGHGINFGTESEEGEDEEESLESIIRIEQLRALALADGLDARPLHAGDLTATERAAFARAVADGALSDELSRELSCWRPWWEEGRSPTNPLIQEESGRGTNDDDDAAVTRIPLPLLDAAAAVPPAAPSSRASPLLRFNLIDVLYAYAHVQRLYVGEWASDPEGAAAVLLALSAVLMEDARYEGVPEAAGAVVERAVHPEHRLASDPAGARAMAVSVLGDVGTLLGGAHEGRVSYVLLALVDARACVEAAVVASSAAVTTEDASPASRSPAQRRHAAVLANAARKLGFFASWAAAKPLGEWGQLRSQLAAFQSQTEAAMLGASSPRASLMPSLLGARLVVC